MIRRVVLSLMLLSLAACDSSPSSVQGSAEAPKPTAEQRQAAAQQAATQAGVELFSSNMSFPALEEDFPAYFRSHVAAVIRYEEANLKAYGPDWRDRSNAEGREFSAFAMQKYGASQEQATRIAYADRSDTTTHHDDMSPYASAMDVAYRPKDDVRYDEAALREKLVQVAAARRSDESLDPAWQEYLRCELSYAIHGGHVATRPVAKPCEPYLDAVGVTVAPAEVPAAEIVASSQSGVSGLSDVQQAEAELTTAWQAVYPRLSGAPKAAFLDGQRQWIRKKDSACDGAADEGTCRSAIIQERIAYLRDVASRIG